MLNLKNIFISALCLMFLFTVSACVDKDKNINSTQDNKENSAYYEFTDDLGNSVNLKEKPQKVVSLVGSYSQMWILSGGELVGVTEDAVSERQLTLGSDTKIIGSVKKPNIEMILELKPDLVLLSTDIDAHVKLEDTLKSAGVTYAYFKEDSIDDYMRILKTYTDITQRSDLYDKYGNTVKSKIDGIVAKIHKEEIKPKVLLIRSMSSKAKALKEDHMVGIMLKDLGTDNIATRHKSLLEDLSMETIIDENPEYIFVVTMGDVDTAIKTMENGIMSNPAWNNLNAVKNGNYYVLPKELFQYKPNERWGESYEYLAKILYK